jgi:hypothetical protein
MGMAQNMGPWGAQPMQPATSAPPPPPPASAQPSPDTVWHIAHDGKTTGPFSTAAMGRMVNDGKLTRDSMVWTAGQEGWKRAEDILPLARLFTVQPPPAPGT